MLNSLTNTTFMQKITQKYLQKQESNKEASIKVDN